MKQEHFHLLRKIQKEPKTNQRALAKNLGLSIGKLNYSLKALQSKGLIKIKNFKQSQNKTKYLYLLTPKGVLERSKATLNFMKIKIKEYEELQAELKNLKDKKKRK